jgi:hypothetical protein
LDRLAVNSRRKAEVIDRLLWVAECRQAEIDRGENVPADALTRMLMNLAEQREQFAERKARQMVEAQGG